jgi:ATP-dependent Clp protease ATP-binding subunit ClpC
MSEFDEDSDLIARYCRDMSAVPDAGAAEPPARSRGLEVLRRIERDLADRRSVVIAGPPGVGKTTLVHQLVGRARRGEGPSELSGIKVYEASCTALMAGTRYVGEWESKVFNLIRSLPPRSILYVTDLWNVIGTGSYHGSSKDLYDSFKTFAERGELLLVGEMTDERLLSVAAREPTFLQLFSVHHVREPADDDVRALLEERARALARRFSLSVGAESLQRVLAITRRFIPYEVFPGKAVRLLDKVFAETAILEGRRTIDPSTVWQVFSGITGLPSWILDDGQPMDLEKARAFFSARVLGQDEAVGHVVDTIALYKARLNDPTKPIGILFFVGPTGVGKTELAKALARYLFGKSDRMVRLDMSEYVTYESLEKLLGKKRPSSDMEASDHGLLTGKVRQQPFSVVLLDEFEKAHPAVYDLMLQVFADGRLTDARGETTDFRNTILVLTSNIGTGKMGSEIGFAGRSAMSISSLETKVLKEMEAHFRPEFINRLDHVVVFRPLDEETMRRIARRELANLTELEGVQDLQPILEVDDAAVDLLVRRGFDRKFGARPLKRAIKELITTPLARLLVAQAPAPRQILRVLARGDQMILDLESTEASQKARALEEKMEIEPPGTGRPARMTVKEVAASIERILRRIESAEAAFGLAAAEDRIRQIETARASPGFWNDPVESSRLLHRYHRLVGEVKRFRDAREMARVVFEATELTVKEKDPALLKDISHEYRRLLDLTDRLEQESTLFTPDHRRDAFLVVAGAGVGASDRRWVEELASVYERWARTKGYRFTVLYRPPQGARDVQVAIKALVEGTYAYGYLAGEEGLHRLVRRPAGGGRQDTETVATRVEVYPLLRTEDSLEGLARREPTVDAVGGGGARRARTGYRVRLAETGAELLLVNTLSEVETRELGPWILRSIVSSASAGASAGAGAGPAAADRADRRGLVRSYDTAENLVIKDKRTGVTVHNLRKVFAGEIDEFLIAYLREHATASALAEGR